MTTLKLWLRTGFTIAVVDFTFASVLGMYGYNVSFERVWQGVASVWLGPMAIGGGMQTIIVGILLHVCVAFTWAGVFVLLVTHAAWLQRIVASPVGVGAVAAVYGPLIWIFMSRVWMPMFTHRTGPISVRWWHQLVGHIFAVGLPIVFVASRPYAARTGTRSEPAA